MQHRNEWVTSGRMYCKFGESMTWDGRLYCGFSCLGETSQQAHLNVSFRSFDHGDLKLRLRVGDSEDYALRKSYSSQSWNTASDTKWLWNLNGRKKDELLAWRPSPTLTTNASGCGGMVIQLFPFKICNPGTVSCSKRVKMLKSACGPIPWVFEGVGHGG